MSELVSIITPSYNTAEYIADTIKSVQAQTYQEWEMIIVDDCSSDNTDLVVSKFLDDNRIQYIKNERNFGAALSRNKALQVAGGRWVAFLDSDDLWDPHKLERQVRFMQDNGYCFSYTKYEEIDERGLPLKITVSGPKTIHQHEMRNYCYPGCLTVMYDAECVGLIQIKDIKKNNDYAMWLEASKKADCHLLGECLGKYRKRQGSISHHGIGTLICWHYRLWREVEGYGRIQSVFATINNIVYGLMKKLVYVKRG